MKEKKHRHFWKILCTPTEEYQYKERGCSCGACEYFDTVEKKWKSVYGKNTLPNN